MGRNRWICVSALWFIVCGIGAEGASSGDGIQVKLCADPPPIENAWPNQVLLKYESSAFAFSRIPQAYTEDGIRDDWPNPLRVVAEAELVFPKGTHEILLRSRRAARLWIDGVRVAENPFPAPISDGHDPVERPVLPLGNGVRFPGPGDQETLVDWQSDGGSSRVRLEFYVGGFAGKHAIRPETGETLVAICLEEEEGFVLLDRDLSIPLTDEGWTQYAFEEGEKLDALDRHRRIELRDSQKDYWEQRHQWAREVAEERGAGTLSSIDAIINQRIDEVNDAIDVSEQAHHFIEEVRPVLEDRCWSCHSSKPKGDLRLDSLEAALAGGNSDIPALVPGNAKESFLLELVLEEFEEDRMPPKGDPLTEEQIEALSKWIDEGAVWPKTTVTKEITPTDSVEDWQFLKRLYLDTIGLLPDEDEVRRFIEDTDPEKRARAIDRLLQDPRWADHWVSYWQDALAENPTIVNPTLNNTGPFRYWIHEALRDDVPMDRFATELIRMEGSLLGGGPAGFEMASQNDVPMAAKANILSTAFLATEMQCSRCHDAPFHDNKQEDLFSIAAMLAMEPIEVPTSSSVPMDKLHTGGRKPLIEVTLPPGSVVAPKWPFPSQLDSEDLEERLVDPESSREQLALYLTNPYNERFPKVLVNRLWARFFGRGIVEPINDWENADPVYPELLDYLALEFVQSGYDLKAVARLILNSDAYQRHTSEDQTLIEYFAAQGPRQLEAEQIVDSLFAAVGKPLETEPLTIDIGGGRPWTNAMSLGQPTRAWMFGGLANNRDRPSLILPRAQAVVDVMTAFGWRASRQEPISYRQNPLSPLQPAILNNGVVSTWLTQLSEDHELTELSLAAPSPEVLAEELYLRILSRFPTQEEARLSTAYLEPGFENRVIENPNVKPESPSEPELFVTWGNHLHPDADGVALKAAAKAKAGDPPTPRLESDWRMRMEDFVWSLINLPETLYYP